MRHETLLLVGDIRDDVVVTSAFFLQEFWFALRKRFAVEGWILCSTLGLTSGGHEEAREIKDNVYLGPPLYWMDLALSLSHWICRPLLGPRSER
jgi:hypothetical protein